MATKTLNLGLVEQMVANYQDKQYQSIITNTVNPMSFDAQSLWFDLEALKSFIATIEDEVAKHPGCGLKDFGIRFYYSAYSPNTDWTSYPDMATVDPAYEKLHTLIGIPTTRLDGVNTDFDPYDTKTYDGSKPSDTALSIMAENHGTLNPPGSNTGLWF